MTTFDRRSARHPALALAFRLGLLGCRRSLPLQHHSRRRGRYRDQLGRRRGLLCYLFWPRPLREACGCRVMICRLCFERRCAGQLPSVSDGDGHREEIEPEWHFCRRAPSKKMRSVTRLLPFSHPGSHRAGWRRSKSGTTVFQLSEETDYLRFDWTSDTSVRITGYSDGEGVMYKERRAGNIDIQFLPVGTL